MGSIVPGGEMINIVNVYAPNDAAARRSMWDELVVLKESMMGLWLLLGDFNEVRSENERRNSEFNQANARRFNEFILTAGLHEYNMGGYKFTYISDNGEKFSKLDRFLVCQDFKDKWPEEAVTALSRHITDHCPIVLSTTTSDYGHVPFRFFDSWFKLPGFVEFVNLSCVEFSFQGPMDLCLITKLKFLKNRITVWVKRKKMELEGDY
ncbi:uncharacterized protein LOC143596536 [Bidens hawaiensis]|uniref:uncharacterized protein LOC143596536 n=1 Tax=Bidens hawaiensis TaxID=980011 RepID=UPI0040490D45